MGPPTPMLWVSGMLPVAARQGVITAGPARRGNI